IGLTTTLKNAWTTSRQVNFFWVANFNLKFGVRKLTQTRYYEEFRNGVKYSGYLRLTDYQKTSDGYYLAYYAGTISR
ncbi:hypothetical protein, partial [Streptococcus suis]|uniref:hypothetical protein n=1 Tax=Streptococcus suis TaxID=1307 RepID=UPI002FC8BAD8